MDIAESARQEADELAERNSIRQDGLGQYGRLVSLPVLTLLTAAKSKRRQTTKRNRMTSHDTRFHSYFFELGLAARCFCLVTIYFI